MILYGWKLNLSALSWTNYVSWPQTYLACRYWGSFYLSANIHADNITSVVTYNQLIPAVHHCIFIVTAKLTTPLEDFVFTSSLTSPKPARTTTVRDYLLCLAIHCKQPACPPNGNKYTLIKLPFILLPVTIALVEDVLCWFSEVCICWRNCHFDCYKKDISDSLNGDKITLNMCAKK